MKFLNAILAICLLSTGAARAGDRISASVADPISSIDAINLKTVQDAIAQNEANPKPDLSFSRVASEGEVRMACGGYCMLNIIRDDRHPVAVSSEGGGDGEEMANFYWRRTMTEIANDITRNPAEPRPVFDDGPKSIAF